ncbi:hypothetical protein [Qipengyuania gelatinilytica]|uniref:Tetratricopeptide repeat protein n=1 Tax=Qipengyuania gelatinilytica TaxID=2867231 RepID=A0ABX9A4H0_9SPHN|nr:hypothetical protein [Qipengyuania gelatinilytica]QZD96115.1 hypothetical protein K3136_05280 [Qipengyuania gelatinilytica]
MSLIAAATLLVFATEGTLVVTAPDTEYDIGYEELVAGHDREALKAIEECEKLSDHDPARQINHAVALARVGEYDEARARFAAAARNADRYELETATGDWVDSRVLARRGLAMIDRGEFSQYVALANR